MATASSDSPGNEAGGSAAMSVGGSKATVTDLRLASRVEPGHFVGGPEVDPVERKRAGDPKRFAGDRPRDREEERRIIALRISGRLAERRAFDRHHAVQSSPAASVEGRSIIDGLF